MVSDSTARGMAARARRIAQALADKAAPIMMALPAISGIMMQGNVLTGVDADWTSTPTSYAFRWLHADDNSAIPGAIGRTYVPTASDAIRGLKFEQTPTNAVGTGAAAVSTAVYPVPSLPMAAGAKVAALGHSYIDRSWATSSTIPGVQALARGVMPYVGAMDRADARANGFVGRLNVLAAYDEAGNRPRFQPTTRVTAVDHGYFGDVISATLGATLGVPGSIARSSYLLTLAPQIIYLDMGLNDVRAGRSASQVIADLDMQINLLVNRGVWVVIQTLSYPKDAFQAQYAATILLINAWIKAQAGRLGVKICDTTATDGTPDAAQAIFTGDNLHVGALCGRLRAAILLAILQPMVSPSTTAAIGALDATNIWPLKGQPGSSGTLTNASGQVATGYNLARAVGNSNYAGSLETISPGNQWQVVTVTPTNNGTLAHTAGLKPTAAATYASLGLAAGDWYELSITVVLDDWAGWSFNSSDQQTVALYAEGYDTTLATAYSSYSDFSGMQGRAVRMTIIGKVPASGDRFRWTNRMILFTHRSDVGGTGVAKFGEPVLAKISNPLTQWGALAA